MYACVRTPSGREAWMLAEDAKREEVRRATATETAARHQEKTQMEVS